MKKESEKMQVRCIKLDDSSPDDVESLSLISNFLKPICRLVYAYKPKSINISRHVWELLVILGILVLVDVNLLDYITIRTLIIFTLILEFISINPDTIKGVFKNKSQDIFYSSKINKLELDDLIIELGARSFNTKTIEDILKTKYVSNIDLHKRIISTQLITSDLIDYIAKNDLIYRLPKGSDKLLSDYIISCQSTLSKESIEILSKLNSSYINGALVVRHPMIYAKNSVLKIMTYPLLFFTQAMESFRDPNNRYPAIISFIFGLLLFLSYPELITLSATQESTIWVSLLMYIEIIMGYTIGINFLISQSTLHIYEPMLENITLPLLGEIYKLNTQ